MYIGWRVNAGAGVLGGLSRDPTMGGGGEITGLVNIDTPPSDGANIFWILERVGIWHGR